MATKKTTKKSNARTTNKKKAGTKRQVAKTGTNIAQKGDAANAAKSKPAKPERQKRTSGLDLAADVLTKAGTPLNAKTIADRVIEAGWQTNGLTPAATLYSAIQREIAKKGSASRFKKVDRGQFAINEARATK